MLELRIMNAGQAMPLFDLPAALGREEAVRELGDTIEGLIAFLDGLGGDPDLEDGGDDEPSGDERDISAKEWEPERRGRPVNEIATRYAYHAFPTEDDEDDDPTEDDDSDRCAAGDDTMTSGPAVDYFAGFYKGQPGDDDDAEPEEDRCQAGDDQIVSGAVMGRNRCTDAPAGHEIGDDGDAEHDRPPTYRIDQTKMLSQLPGIDAARWWRDPA